MRTTSTMRFSYDSCHFQSTVSSYYVISKSTTNMHHSNILDTYGGSANVSQRVSICLQLTSIGAGRAMYV